MRYFGRIGLARATSPVAVKPFFGMTAEARAPIRR
jgi:hypothetical protein